MQALIDVILPVFIVIGFGYVAAWRRWVADATIDGVMKFAQNFAVPTLLFAGIARIAGMRVQADTGIGEFGHGRAPAGHRPRRLEPCHNRRIHGRGGRTAQDGGACRCHLPRFVKEILDRDHHPRQWPRTTGRVGIQRLRRLHDANSIELCVDPRHHGCRHLHRAVDDMAGAILGPEGDPSAG